MMIVLCETVGFFFLCSLLFFAGSLRKRCVRSAARPAAPALCALSADWNSLSHDLMIRIATMLAPGDYSRLACVDQRTRQRLTDPEQLAHYEAGLANRFRTTVLLYQETNYVGCVQTPLVCDFRAWRAFAGDNFGPDHVEYVDGSPIANPGVLLCSHQHGVADFQELLFNEQFACMLAYLHIAYIVSLVGPIDFSENRATLLTTQCLSVANARSMLNSSAYFELSPNNLALFLQNRDPREYSALFAHPSRVVDVISANTFDYLTILGSAMPSEHAIMLLACLKPNNDDYAILTCNATCELFLFVASRAASVAALAQQVLECAIHFQRTDVINALLSSGPLVDLTKLVDYARFPGREALASRISICAPTPAIARQDSTTFADAEPTSQFCWDILPCEIVCLIASKLALADYTRLACVDTRTRSYLTDPQQLRLYEAGLDGQFRSIDILFPTRNRVLHCQTPIVFDFHAWRAFAGDESAFSYQHETIDGKQFQNPGVQHCMLQRKLIDPPHVIFHPPVVCMITYLHISQIVSFFGTIDFQAFPHERELANGLSIRNARMMLNTPSYFNLTCVTVAQFLAHRNPADYPAILASPSRVVDAIMDDPISYFSEFANELPNEHIIKLFECINPTHYDYFVLTGRSTCDLFLLVASRSGKETFEISRVITKAIEFRRTDAIIAMLDSGLLDIVPHDPSYFTQYVRYPGREALAARISAHPQLSLLLK